MADPTRVNNAMAELQAAIKEFVGAAATPTPTPEPPDDDPYVKFTNFPPFQAKEMTFVVDSNIADLQWVLFAENEKHTWYGDPQPVPGNKTFTVRAQADGDRVKVFDTEFNYAVDSLPFKFAETVPDTVVVSPVVGGSDAEKVNAFLSYNGKPLTGGVNLEREWMQQRSQSEMDYIRKQVPMDTARAFLAWRPYDGIFAGNQARGAWQPPTPEFVAEFVGGLKRMQKSGFKRALVDCSDVCEDPAFSERGVALLHQTCEMVALEIKKQGIGPDFVAVGPINEWATSQDNVHKHQDALLATLRKHLPGYILTYGTDYWKYWGKLIENQNYKPPKDTLSLCDAHSYKAMDAAGWKWLAGEFDKWQKRTGRRIVFGEAGCGELFRDEQNYNVYPANIRTMMPIMRPFVPITWSMNNGGHWKLNWNGAEFVNKQAYPNGGNAPAIADALNDALGLR